MLKIIIAGLLMAGVCSADTFYYVGGKQLTAAEATKASLNDPSVEVLKVSVNFTKINPNTARLNKSRAAKVSDIPR